MFTPPPSPAPARIARYSSSDPDSSKQDEPLPQYAQYAQYTQYTDTLSCTQPGSSSVNLAASHIDPTYRSYQMKKQTGRRTKWFIILAPALLILITLSTRYISQPILRAVQPHHIRPVDPIWPPTPVHAPILKRAPQASGTATPSASPSALSLASPTNSASSLASSLSSSPSPSGTQLLPTIPSSPPVLPTPFPQPWDTTLSNNFSTANCQNFFNNITQATSFRECRPFSLLQKVSSAFIQVSVDLFHVDRGSRAFFHSFLSSLFAALGLSIYLLSRLAVALHHTHYFLFFLRNLRRSVGVR